MESGSDNDLHRRCLLDTLLPSLTGIFVVTVLMSGLYWLALRSLRAVLPAQSTLSIFIVKNIENYSLLTAISVALAAVLFLLFAVKYIHYLRRPLQLTGELNKISSHLEDNRILRAHVYLFKKMRERIIILIAASMAAPFVLLGGLYLAVISAIYRFGQLTPAESILLFKILGYYGTLVLLVLVLCGISLVNWAFHRLKNTFGLDQLAADSLDKIFNDCPRDSQQLEKEIEKLLLLVELEDKEGEVNYEL